MESALHIPSAIHAPEIHMQTCLVSKVDQQLAGKINKLMF